MVDHVKAQFPNEGCGLLAGQDNRIEAVYCLDNVDRSPTRYTIDPRGHFEALQDAERRGWDLIGAFHSHVYAAAYPSPTDIAKAAEPDWLWVVIGSVESSPEIRAFRIVGDRVMEEELIVGR